jgi:hypothetical protein
MKIPRDYTNEEVDAMIDKMGPEGTMFLRAVTARLIQALANHRPVVVILPEDDEADVYAKGMDNKEIYDTLVSTADLMLDTMASAPSTDTPQ